MKNFLITLFLGWLGVHKFMKKKYILGILYLCTLGLFSIGWIIDTIIAFMQMVNGEQPSVSNSKDNISQTGNQVKIFTKLQIEGMTKAGILELATGLGYVMGTVESNTKDKIVADFMAQQEKQPSTDKRKWLIKTFNTEIVGTFAECGLDKNYERSDIICSLKPNSRLDLEYWEYKGEPAFYVCNNGLDAGCVPATISKTLHNVYADCELMTTLRGGRHI